MKTRGWEGIGAGRSRGKDSDLTLSVCSWKWMQNFHVEGKVWMLNPFMRRKIKWFHQTISVKNITLIVLTEHLINAYRTPNKQGCDLSWWINTFNKHSKQKISVYCMDFFKCWCKKQLLSLIITTGGQNHTKNECFGHSSVAEVNSNWQLIS